MMPSKTRSIGSKVVHTKYCYAMMLSKTRSTQHTLPREDILLFDEMVEGRRGAGSCTERSPTVFCASYVICFVSILGH